MLFRPTGAMPDAFNNLGIVLRQQGTALRQQGKLEEAGRKLDESIIAHKKGLELRNDRASDHNNLCGTYLEKGDFDDAMKENKIALKCDPNFLDAWTAVQKSSSGRKSSTRPPSASCGWRPFDSKSPQTIGEEVSFAGKCTIANSTIRPLISSASR